jgi:hypothetical protein
MSGEDGLHYLTSLEYDELIRGAEDISSLASFANSLVKLNQWKDERYTCNTTKIAIMC